MSDDVKGVFVRLPLSDEQRNKIIYRTGGYESTLLAIGTPVTGDGLETEVVRVREYRKDIELPWTYHKAPPSDQDASEFELEVDRLITHKQALAKLAEKDAEIARYREALSKISSVVKDKKYTETYSALKFCETEAQEALKGPEA